ncbi:MAG TPA: rhodanese-like domain-containing protein [Gemmatimonadaceae bacterium]|nr:rhodanese-like domain-containing protein [Gemmatimonadaceae bacterium]
MLLERYYDDSLAQASFLIGCERSREAIVIDPNRDTERYVAAAAAHRMAIRYVTETHVHADFLSGSRALAERTKATLLLSGHGGKDWSYRFGEDNGSRTVREGERIQVGSVVLEVLHMPGHTPEHIVFVVTDTATADRAMGMVTGDFVFVGDVGRPDLLERAAGVADTMDAAARQLYQSLQRLQQLPDYLQLWPGHGAGSACGKSLGSVPQTTLGYERLVNPAFQHKTADAFARWVLADQPEPPRYFAVMKQLNRDGPPPRPDFDSFRQLDAAAVASALRQHHWVVDVRSTADFAKLHVAGAINIPASHSLPTYAGTVLDYARPIVIIANTREQAQKVIAQLALIGMDNVAGFTTLAVLDQLKSEYPLATTRSVQAQAVMQRLDGDGTGPQVIDVRKSSEWNAGHLPHATHVFLGDLEARMQDADRDAPLVVHCQTGSRASIAASLLRARGFTDVAVLAGGYEGWRKSGLPVITE